MESLKGLGAVIFYLCQAMVNANNSLAILFFSISIYINDFRHNLCFRGYSTWNAASDTERNQHTEPFPRTKTPLVIFTCSGTPHISWALRHPSPSTQNSTRGLNISFLYYPSHPTEDLQTPFQQHFPRNIGLQEDQGQNRRKRE